MTWTAPNAICKTVHFKTQRCPGARIPLVADVCVMRFHFGRREAEGGKGEEDDLDVNLVV